MFISCNLFCRGRGRGRGRGTGRGPGRPPKNPPSPQKAVEMVATAQAVKSEPSTTESSPHVTETPQT